MSHVNGIICIYKKGNAVLHLFLVCIIEFIERSHLGYIAGRNSDHLALIHTIGKYKLQRTAHIKECCIMPSLCLTCFLWLYATDDIILTGICKGKSSVLQCWDDYLVVIISRKSDTRSGKLCCLDQKVMRRTIPYTDGKGRSRKMYMHGCLNTHKGKVIGHIIAIFILTSYDQVLEQTVACEAFCGSSITDFIQVI